MAVKPGFKCGVELPLLSIQKMKTMYFSMKKIIATSIILSCIIDCQEETVLITNDASDHFFLKNNGAEMPVFVKGNTSSGTFISNLHGGPSGGAISTDEFNIYKEVKFCHCLFALAELRSVK